MSVASTNSLMCASISSRSTAPSDNPRENAKPADVVAIALNPRCCRYLAVPMSHGFGIAKHPLSWRRRNSARLSSIDFMTELTTNEHEWTRMFLEQKVTKAYLPEFSFSSFPFVKPVRIKSEFVRIGVHWWLEKRLTATRNPDSMAG